MNKKLFWYIAGNGLFMASTVGGLLYDSEPLLNVAVFVAWATFVASLLFLSSGAQKVAMEKKHTRSVPAWVDRTFDATILLLFVSQGYVWLPAGYLIHMLILEGHQAAVSEELNK